MRVEAPDHTHAEMLAEIRVEAMRPSLQAAGRFDAERAKNRFLSSFQPLDTKIVYFDESVAGFFVVRDRQEYLYLDHLYIKGSFQGRGIGRWIINNLQEQARVALLPIRLVVLNGSPSNAFYLSCDFDFVSEDALDTLYEWTPMLL